MKVPCAYRTFDFSIFHGKVKIVMADPPWDIHMDLPYGTMTDAEMKALRVQNFVAVAICSMTLFVDAVA